MRFRCHVGHAYSAEMMSLMPEDSLRRALGGALRALDERHCACRKAPQSNRLTAHWAQKKEEIERAADVIRQAIKRADEIGAKAA
jgi:two-component system chemotaxis response regulator CheB